MGNGKFGANLLAMKNRLSDIRDEVYREKWSKRRPHGFLVLTLTAKHITQLRALLASNPTTLTDAQIQALYKKVISVLEDTKGHKETSKKLTLLYAYLRKKFGLDTETDNENPLTEKMVGLGKSPNQDEWNKRAENAINELYKRMLANQNLYEIYEYARIERSAIADDLGQTFSTSDAIQFGQSLFGKIREQMHGVTSGDIYMEGKLIVPETGRDLFPKLLEIVAQQNNLKKTEIVNGQSKTIKYASGDCCSDEMLLVHSIDYEKGTKTDERIKVYYPYSDEDYYKEKMQQFDLIFSNLKSNHCKNDEAAFKLGLLLHDLCSLNPISRGSAAVHGWLARAIARMKEIPVQNLRIFDIPFDMYAQVQRDRTQFAKDFASAIKPDFVFHPDYLNIDVRYYYINNILQLIEPLTPPEDIQKSKDTLFAPNQNLPSYKVKLTRLNDTEIPSAQALHEIQEVLADLLNKKGVFNSDTHAKLNNMSTELGRHIATPKTLTKLH
ncbi:Uncharacterised protein [Legionella steigerwaltii]|uniref:Uncharacterized protein n=1 Tax=Legionella steigerwaltii TaxID=460 RepID=A0A378LBI0_9GAMM|nr:hypothetical protein [Legionella steigerwaltii]KTD78557.1 hypothetical protein Lstg_1292 [Legionella steigerwaltii]STY24084.1 Uncharacterised protein [Legionella steigerwaltii]